MMAIVERTKSNIDATLYEGHPPGSDRGRLWRWRWRGPGSIEQHPTMPAHWATVWDTLGYTDTGFIGDYVATDLAVTGMDYEILLNHSAPDQMWTVYLQENHINALRQIIKTAMAYALNQKRSSTHISRWTRRPGGLPLTPRVTSPIATKNGPGTLPGPGKDGVGENGKKVRSGSLQRHEP